MKIKFLLILSTVVYFQTFAKNMQCLPVELRTEHLEKPIGLDVSNPRFSWMVQDSRQGAKQKGYQIYVDTDSIAVLKEISCFWTTGKQDKDDILVTYAGGKLKPQTRYYWKVNIWDKNGKMSSSAITFFETGMMGMENWQGAWIGDGHSIEHKEAPYFRKGFNLTKKVKSARAYIAVGGLYEMYLNGEKVGNHRLDPMYTRFDRRNLYVTYDITSQLRNGENAIGVILGNGWYNHQSMGVWDFDKAPWRNRPTFCLDIKVVYTDGTEQIIKSDLSWKTSSGPVVFNSIYTGEHYDARLEMDGWASPSFDDSKWHGVKYRSVPSRNVVGQQVEPIRNVETIVPLSVTKLDDKTYVYDLGRNIAGVTKIKVKGEEGTILKIKHAERKYKNGHVDLSNIDVYFRGDKETDPFQTDILILSGKKEDEFMAKFNYKGFRYVEVAADKPIELDKNSVVGYFMHSDVKPVGEIKTSSNLINKLWWATNNSYLSNLMGLPTDCPQREKNGWTGDAHLAIETALYNFDGITVYEKWLADHRDEQQPNGVLPDIIPTGGWGYGTDNGLDWTSTIAIIPWEIYMFYGDSRLLEDTYDNIKSYVNYVERISNNGLTSFGRGDWVPVKSVSNLELTSSTYLFVDATILANAAKIFNKKEDYEYYSALAKKIKNAINKKYLNYDTGVYASGTQTEQSVPIQWGVVPEEMKSKAVAFLTEKVKATNYHLDVGVLGAKALLNALSQNGQAETAYKVAAQDAYPSWGWWIVNGATTLLENWDLKAERDISDNHMMFGEIGGWFFKGLGGIFPDPEQPGFKHILLRPNFVQGLEKSAVKHQSPYGEILSKWERKKKSVVFSVIIPANSSATFFVPENVEGKREYELEAGKHEFKLKVKKN